MNALKKAANKVGEKISNSKIVKNPKFLIIGLIAIIIVIALIYFIFLKYSPVMNFKYEGYAISGKEITENLLGSSEESTTNKNIELTKIEEQGTIFKKINDYFVGNKEKTEINLNYPIYINGNSAIYNLAESSTLISKDFEQVTGYPNLSISEGKVYDGNNLERADGKEYIFVKTADEIYINLYEIKIKTTANEYTIPVNSIIALTENTIRYYTVNNNVLVFNQINDVDKNSNVQMVENNYTYEELLTRLGILQAESNNKESNESQTNIIKEDSSNSKIEENQENEVEQEPEPEENEEEPQNGYIKPEVSVEDFIPEVYTAKSVLTIKDPAGRIVEAPTFEIYKDNKIYLRRTYTNSGNITVTGLVPETEYKIVGKYVYLNENGQKVENTFYEGTFATKGYEELGSIDIKKENGEIFSNKIQLTKVKITSDLNAEVIKGISQVEIETGDIRTVLKNNQVNSLLRGEEITIESSDGLKSDSKINYIIKFYDKNGIELKVNNNTGETRTSKEKPIARVSIKEQDIVSVTLRLNLTNKDNVELENYKYIVTRPNGEKVKEERLAENEKEILLNDLDQNQYYKISIYTDYDLNDNKGKQENVEIGNLVFATQPISTLGSLELAVENKELTSTTSTISYQIDEDRTDKRLIQILNELTINIKDGENIVKTDILSGEEISNLQQAGTKEIKYENLKSNTTYTIEITGNVQLGNTQEKIAITYNYKEFTTLKIPAKVEIRNQFTTGNLIDFDIRIEDIDNSVLNNKVRMELRNSSNDLIDLQEITTNDDFIRKTYEKLEENQTYKLSFYADQYNEGNTDSTYKVNYLIKEIEIVTEPGISGSIGLTELSRKATGKNLVDMSSEIKWYVYPNFNTTAYYGKEYNEESKTLTLGGHSNGRRAVYDLREYAGQEVTMSFKAKAVSGSQSAYIQNSKTDVNRTQIQGLTTEWKDFQYTLTVDSTGYLGFYINGGNGIEIKELQIELGNKKTSYEEFKYVLASNYSINLEDRRDEITTNDYYIKVYEDRTLIKTDRYEEIPEENIITNAIKTYEIQAGKQYKIELVINLRDREYVISELEYNTTDTEEIKGIYNKEDFLEIQPYGNYIVLNDMDFTGTSGSTYQFGSASMQFNGKIDFNGKKITKDVQSSCLIYEIGTNAIIENLVLDVKINNTTSLLQQFRILSMNSYGTVRNLQMNIVESNALPNWRFCVLERHNYGTIENFVVNVQETVYTSGEFGLLCWYNYGTIKNGYIYGKNINTEFVGYSTTKAIGTVADKNVQNGQIKNVFSLVNIDDIETGKGQGIGNITYINQDNATVENVYSVGLGKNITNTTNGPNVYSAGGKISNNYYFNDKIFTNSYHQKTTMLALHDVIFQNQILNSESRFDIEEYVSQGYYPQVIMPSVMPRQEYIQLPEVQDADLADILSTEILENDNTNVKVKFNVNNPSADTITNIKLENIECEIISQEYSDGKSEVIAILKNPTIYISKYDVISITTKGAFSQAYTRSFSADERTIQVDLYREINNLDDWKEINNSPTENYILMDNLDFINESSNMIISKVFTGKLEGNGHAIKNIRIENVNSGLFIEVQGEINNLNIENFTREDEKTERVGLIDYLNKGKINNVHIKNVNITISKDYKKNVYIGGLVAYGVSGNISNSSVNELVIDNQSGTARTSAGGLIAVGSGNSIENCFTQNISVTIKKATEVIGIGGIYGYDSSANNIYNCYAIGKIESDNSNIGGIGGFLKSGDVQRCYSDVNIISDGEYLGGIVGRDSNNVLTNINYNLAIGNIYNKQKSDNISRAVGNSKEEENNYAYTNQRINGQITTETEGATLLSSNNLKDQNVYKSVVQLGDSYSYEQIGAGILPKLYNIDGTKLLPNQEDYKLEEDMELEIEEVEVEKTSSNNVAIRIVLINSRELPIKTVNIEDMEIRIDKISTQNRKTYIDITATPIAYYDSYRIYKVIYEEAGEEKEKEIDGRVDVEFYKEIYSFEDWQEIGQDSYENYRLMSDIDFKNRSNIKTDLSIGKLEGNGHKLSNISITLNSVNSGFIKVIRTTLKDVVFENIEIKNTASGDRTGVIANIDAKVDNITINNITINAPKMNRVGFIGNSTSEEINNIVMDTVAITGQNYVAGYAGYTEFPKLRQLDACKLTIQGSGNYVAGVIGYLNKRIGYNAWYVTVTDSEVRGVDYVGGIFSLSSTGGDNPTPGRYLTSIRNDVTGKNYVGGIAGYFYDSNSFECYEVTVKGSGSNIGGAVGTSNITNSKVVDSTVEGTSANSNNVGGLVGSHSWGNSNNVVIDTIVKSNGNNVGGISGTYHNQSSSCSNNIVKGGSVTGNLYIGGIVGYLQQGAISKTYTDTKVTANSNYAGGIVGYSKNQNMDTNTAGIRNCYVANSTIQAKNNAGGLVGAFSNSLEGGYQYFYNDYIQADVVGNNIDTTSLGFGNQKNAIVNMENMYVYRYSTINGKNITTDNEPFISEEQYLEEQDLKLENTYKNKIGWGTSYTYSILTQGKYPILNSSALPEQEGIDLPKDADHNISGQMNSIINNEIQATSINEDNQIILQTPEQNFEYAGIQITTYSTYSLIIAEDGTQATRNAKLYVKDNNLYAIPSTLSESTNSDENIVPVANNLIVDSYNGKEYETVLGSDGKIYDLKEPITYPENFVNLDIESIGNNLNSDEKEIEVTYKNGDKIKFNYQTGEVISSSEAQNTEKTGLFDYLKEKISEIGDTSANEVSQEIKTKYEESKELQTKLEETSVEEAMEKQNIAKSDEGTEGATTTENNVTNNSLQENKYISMYNEETGQYEIYNEEELLDTTKEEVVSENEKIEANNLSEYYASEGETKNTKMGIVWIVISIIGVGIILFVLRKNLKKKNA